MAEPVAAGAAHAMALAAIHAASFPSGEQWSAAAFATQLGLPGVSALIDPAGALVLTRVAADEAEILTLAVAPALRRQGRARRLLQLVKRHAGAAGAARLFLEVAASNAAARALYAEAGFREVGQRSRYYTSGETAIVLRAEISASAATDGSLPARP